MYLQKVKTEIKNVFDKNHRIRIEKFRKNDLIMLHDIRLINQHFEKLTFRWLKFFRIFRVFFQNNTYIIAELNDAKLRKIVFNNRLKQFYFRKRFIFEISSKNPNFEFNNSVLKNDQQSIHFDKKDFQYLVDKKIIFRTEIKVKISAVSNWFDKNEQKEKIFNFYFENSNIKLKTKTSFSFFKIIKFFFEYLFIFFKNNIFISTKITLIISIYRYNRFLEKQIHFVDLIFFFFIESFIIFTMTKTNVFSSFACYCKIVTLSLSVLKIVANIFLFSFIKSVFIIISRCLSCSIFFYIIFWNFQQKTYSKLNSFEIWKTSNAILMIFLSKKLISLTIFCLRFKWSRIVFNNFKEMKVK